MSGIVPKFFYDKNELFKSPPGFVNMDNMAAGWKQSILLIVHFGVSMFACAV